MRIAGYKIDLSEIDRRVIAVFVVIILGIIFWLFFRPKEAPPDPSLTPATITSINNLNQPEEVVLTPELIKEFDAKGQNWFNETFGENVDLRDTDTNNQLYELSNRGTPINLRVFIPSDPQGEFPELFFKDEGITFTAGYFIPPTKRLTTGEDVESISEDDPRPVQLAIPRTVGQVGSDVSLQVQGVLWYQSNRLQEKGLSPEATGPAPTILVSSYQDLSPSELAYPTDYIAEINQTYQQYPYRIQFKNIEWATSSQLRVCVKLKNISNQPQDVWPGVEGDNTYVIYGAGAKTSGASPEGGEFQLNEGSDLLAGQEISDYIVFGSDGDGLVPKGTPENDLGSEALQLSFPGLGSKTDVPSVMEFLVGASSFVLKEEADTQGITQGCSSD